MAVSAGVEVWAVPDPFSYYSFEASHINSTPLITRGGAKGSPNITEYLEYGCTISRLHQEYFQDLKPRETFVDPRYFPGLLLAGERNSWHPLNVGNTEVAMFHTTGELLLPWDHLPYSMVYIEFYGRCFLSIHPLVRRIHERFTLFVDDSLLSVYESLILFDNFTSYLGLVGNLISNG